MPEPDRITRRDFLNGTLLASGAALISAACPFQLMAAEDWDGASGIGDYAGANGNTHQVMADGHMIRDHAFDRTKLPIEETGETFDCVIVGGGISGLAAALFYKRAMSAKRTGAKKSCLVLENHSIFGGEAKRNEFDVDGQRLIASQGSAMWFQPMPGSFLAHFYDSVGIDPRQFQYQQNAGGIATGVTPYAGDGSNFGFYFGADARHPKGTWLVDPWTKRLEGAPISAESKRELLAMREVPDHRPVPRRHGDAVARQLDSITLEDDLMTRHGLSRDTIRRYLSPVSGGGSGIGADVLSAYSDYAPDLLFPWEKEHGPQMFPGGNTGVARHMVKALLPAAIPGPATMTGICQARVNLAALDQRDQATRIRLRSTVISLEHEGDPARSPHVTIVYFREGRLHRVRARSVVLANGNWTINSIVRDLPAEYRHAYAQFFRAPCIMANVAVRNWRFLAKMGISQCQWFDGIGNYLAVRRVATFGGGAPVLSPDSSYGADAEDSVCESGQIAAGADQHRALSDDDDAIQRVREAAPRAVRQHVWRAGIRRTPRHCGHHSEPLGACLSHATARLFLRKGWQARAGRADAPPSVWTHRLRQLRSVGDYGSSRFDHGGASRGAAGACDSEHRNLRQRGMTRHRGRGSNVSMPQAAASRLHLSEIAPHLVQSEIRSMTVECDRVGGVNLAQGVCDTELPAPVRKRRLPRSSRGTTSTRGWTGLRRCARRSAKSSRITTTCRRIPRRRCW